MSTRNPAAARSSSDSPPQKPYSRLKRAQSRHSWTTGQFAHTARALASRTCRASGRSPGGAKNNSVRPWHAASDVQANGPLKIRLETDSTTATASLPRSAPKQEGRLRGSVGGYRPSESSCRHPDRWPRICPTVRIDGIHHCERWKILEVCMELRHLDTLLAIADEGSFTAAADVLSTVQSNVSEQVRQLEEELGADLLVRGRRGAMPTECGAAVLERARRIRRELEAMQADLSMLQGLRTGHASLGIVGTASRWMIPALVADLRSEAPGVQLRINEGASERLASEVLAGELGQAVVTEPMTSPRLEVEHLLDETLVGLVPAGASDLGPEPVPLARLAELPVILPPVGNPLRREVDDAAAAAGLTLSVPVEVEGIRLIADMVAAGGGASVLPETAIPPELAGVRRVALRVVPFARRPGRAGRRPPVGGAPRAGVRDAHDCGKRRGLASSAAGRERAWA